MNNWTNFELLGCDDSHPLHKQYLELASDVIVARQLRDQADELGRVFDAAFRAEPATADGREYFDCILQALEQELEVRDRMSVYLEAMRQHDDARFLAARDELARIEDTMRVELGLEPGGLIPTAARQLDARWRKAMLAAMDNGGWIGNVIRKHAAETIEARKQYERFRVLHRLAEEKAKRQAEPALEDRPVDEPWYRKRGRELADAAKQMLAKAGGKSKR